MNFKVRDYVQAKTEEELFQFERDATKVDDLAILCQWKIISRTV